MSLIGFNGQGYNSFVCESTDLVHWDTPRLAMGFGNPGEFDCAVGNKGRCIGLLTSKPL
jgi:hypothetical protein